MFAARVARGQVLGSHSMSSSSRPVRERKAVVRHGQVATDTVEYNSFASLLPSTQDIMAAARNAAAAATAGSPLSQSQRNYGEISSDSEHSEVSQTQQLLQADATLGDDERAHAPTRTPKPRAAKGSPHKPAATAASKKRATRLTPWTPEEDMQLVNGMLAHVQREGGMLPGSLRTSKGAPVSPVWLKLAADVAQTCEKVKALGDDNARAKAISNRWAALRASMAVSTHAHMMSAAVCLFADADTYCACSSYVLRTGCRPSTVLSTSRR
jgi:hypothetical protein